MSEPAALGFRTDSGWTAVVVVSGTPSRPIVLSDDAELKPPRSAHDC